MFRLNFMNDNKYFKKRINSQCKVKKFSILFIWYKNT